MHAIRFGAEQWPRGIQVRVRNPDVPLEILRQAQKGQSPVGAWIGELLYASAPCLGGELSVAATGQTLSIEEARLIANDDLGSFGCARPLTGTGRRSTTCRPKSFSCPFPST
jgi:hypothetical protein